MKRKIKWLLGICIVFVLLFVGAWQFENWRGKRAWDDALARAEAAGVSTDFSVPQKPDIPDEENLLKNEVFLAEYRGEVEPVLQNWDKLEIAESAPTKKSRRKVRPRISDNPAEGSPIDFRSLFVDQPDAQIAEKRVDEFTKDIQERIDTLAELILSYPVHDLDDYGKFDPEVNTTGVSSVKVGNMLNLCRSLKIQAILSLRLNRSEKALRNFKAIDRLAEGMQRPGSMNAQIARVLKWSNKSIIWEGIRRHSWSDTQLNELVAVLNSDQPIAEVEEALRSELLYSLHTMEFASAYYPPELFAGEDGDKESEPGFGLKVRHSFGTKGPGGWTLQRKAILLNSYADLMAYRDEWYNTPDDGDRWDGWPGDPSIFKPFFVANYANMPVSSAVSRGLKSETGRRIVLIALSAEKHYLEQGSYPASLAEMKLGFDATDVTDPKQRPISYMLDKDGRPEIWSIHESQNSKREGLRWQFWESDKKP